MQGNLMTAVVCVLRGRDACMRFMGTVRFMRGVWVRHSIPRGFAVPQWGLAQSADLPQGSALLDGNGGVRVAAA